MRVEAGPEWNCLELAALKKVRKMEISLRSLGSLAASGLAAAPVLVSGVDAAHADQPFMQEALAALRGARNALLNAAPNKGGHRNRAIALIDKAISEVVAGIEFAR